MKRDARGRKKNKKDRKILKERRKKKWIWKMLPDTYRENGNGSMKKVENYSRKRRRAERARRRSDDRYV